MLTKISKLNLSYLTKSCRHTLSQNEKILRQIYLFVAFCNNGDRQGEPCSMFKVAFKEYALVYILEYVISCSNYYSAFTGL